MLDRLLDGLDRFVSFSDRMTAGISDVGKQASVATISLVLARYVGSIEIGLIGSAAPAMVNGLYNQANIALRPDPSKLEEQWIQAQAHFQTYMHAGLGTYVISRTLLA